MTDEIANMNPVPFQTLVHSLRDGWAVQAPVYYRQRWYTNSQSKLGFYFILKKGDETDLIIVPDDERIRELIGTHKLKVMAS